MGKRKKSDDEPMTVHRQLSKDEQRLEAFLRWLIGEAEAKRAKRTAEIGKAGLISIEDYDEWTTEATRQLELIDPDV